MLMECNLYELLNLTIDAMCRKFSSIPERFLRCFYSTTHKCYLSTTPEKNEDLTEYVKNSCNESSESFSEFELKPNFQKMADSPNFNYSNTFADMTREQLYDTRVLPKYLNNAPYDNIKHNSQEKSLQELDLDYMSLKICNTYEEYQSSFDEEEFLTSNHISKLTDSRPSSIPEKEQKDNSPLFTFESLSSQLSNESHLSFDSNTELEKSIDSSYKHLLKVGSTSNYITNPGNANIEHEFPVTFSTQNSQHTAKKSLDFNRFKYAPNKRKLTVDDESSKQVQKQPHKTQKGMTSKTVFKQDLIYKSPFGSQEILPSRSPNRKKAKVFPFMVRQHDYYKSSKSSTGRTSQMEEGINSFEKYQLSQCSDFDPMRSIPLTPRTNRRLGFERAPGLSGQTRLVFQ